MLAILEAVINLFIVLPFNLVLGVVNIVFSLLLAVFSSCSMVIVVFLVLVLLFI